jgi:hypothetical protein
MQNDSFGSLISNSPVPEIIENMNPPVEQFGPESKDLGEMHVPPSVEAIPGYLYSLFKRIFP